MLVFGVMSEGTGMGIGSAALLSRRVEVPEQRLNLAQRASYVALFWNMCASGEGKARKPGRV